MSLMRFFYLLNFYQHGHVLYILIKDINLYLEDLIFFLLSKWAAFDDEIKKGYQKSIILIKDINLYLQELKLFLLSKWAGFDNEKRVLEEHVHDKNFFMFSIFINMDMHLISSPKTLTYIYKN